MSLKIEISSNAEQLARQFERLPERVQKGFSNGLQRALLVVEDKVRVRCHSTSAGSVKFTGARGGLSSRLTSYVKRVPGMGLDGAIGFRRTRGFPYELSQEFGARAKPGKAMSIPITDQARRYDSPRDFPEPLRMVKGPRRVVLVSKRSKIGIVAQYVLVKSIPPRLGFRETVTGQAGFISDEMVQGAQAAI
jgi:hypothetical protein